MSKLPKWVNVYSKIGIAAFSAQQTQILMAIRNKYAVEWSEWLGELREVFSGRAPGEMPLHLSIEKDLGVPGDEAMLEQVDALADLVSDTGRLLDKVLQGTATRAEIVGLYGNLEPIAERFDLLFVEAKTRQDLKEQMDQVQEKTGISFDRMRGVHSQVSARLKELKATRKSRGSWLPSEVRGVGTEVFQGGLSALLGPFAPIAELALSTITGIAQRADEVKSEKKAARLAIGLGGSPREIATLKSAALSEQGVSPVRLPRSPVGKPRGRQATTPLGGMLPGMGAGRPYEAGPQGVEGRAGSSEFSMPPAPWWPRPQREETVVGPVDEKSLKESAMPMFYFFDKMAINAKWTKEVLRRLGGKKTGDPSGEFTAVAGVLGVAAGALSALIVPLSALALSLTAGIVLARDLIKDPIVKTFAASVKADLAAQDVRRETATGEAQAAKLGDKALVSTRVDYIMKYPRYRRWKTGSSKEIDRHDAEWLAINQLQKEGAVTEGSADSLLKSYFKGNASVGDKAAEQAGLTPDPDVSHGAVVGISEGDRAAMKAGLTSKSTDKQVPSWPALPVVGQGAKESISVGGSPAERSVPPQEVLRKGLGSVSHTELEMERARLEFGSDTVDAIEGMSGRLSGDLKVVVKTLEDYNKLLKRREVVDSSVDDFDAADVLTKSIYPGGSD